jgi:hypothetical protein
MKKSENLFQFGITLSILILLLGIWAVKSAVVETIVKYNGDLVIAKVIEEASSCVNYNSRITVLYNQQKYSIIIGPNACGRYIIGSRIEFRYLLEYNILIFPKSKPEAGIGLGIIIVLFGIYSIFASLKNKE